MGAAKTFQCPPPRGYAITPSITRDGQVVLLDDGEHARVVEAVRVPVALGGLASADASGQDVLVAGSHSPPMLMALRIRHDVRLADPPPPKIGRKTPHSGLHSPFDIQNSSHPVSAPRLSATPELEGGRIDAAKAELAGHVAFYYRTFSKFDGSWSDQKTFLRGIEAASNRIPALKQAIEHTAPPSPSKPSAAK